MGHALVDRSVGHGFVAITAGASVFGRSGPVFCLFPAAAREKEASERRAQYDRTKVRAKAEPAHPRRILDQGEGAERENPLARRLSGR